MSFIEIHPQLTAIENEMRGIRFELKRIADCFEMNFTPELPRAYNKPKKGAESVAYPDEEKIWEKQQEREWRESQGLSPNLSE